MGAALRAGVLVAAGVAVFSPGCATHPVPADGSEGAGPSQTGLRTRVCGVAIRVRDAERWVVLECSVFPAPGQVVGLSRGGEAVARVRLTAHRRGPNVIAEIVEGLPMAGDVIETVSQRTEERP
jgi:hypothetical protein